MYAVSGSLFALVIVNGVWEYPWDYDNLTLKQSVCFGEKLQAIIFFFIQFLESMFHNWIKNKAIKKQMII